MRGFFQRVSYTLSRFMTGRYGYDSFGRFLIITALVLSVLSYIPDFGWMYLLSSAVLIYALFRILSRNHAKRRNELNKYIKLSAKPKAWFAKNKRMWSERKTHRYFKCKTCRTVLRVPKGRGKIKISCPKCKSEIIRKT